MPVSVCTRACYTSYTNYPSTAIAYVFFDTKVHITEPAEPIPMSINIPVYYLEYTVDMFIKKRANVQLQKASSGSKQYIRNAQFYIHLGTFIFVAHSIPASPGYPTIHNIRSPNRHDSAPHVLERPFLVKR